MIQSGLVIRTLGKFCELSAYPFDYLSFKEKQPVHSTRSDFQNIGAFEEELMATGDFFSLSFIRRKFTVSELQAALDTQNAPFIVYRKGENVIPLLLFKSEKQIRYCEINGDEIREGVCENLTAWLSDVNGDLDGVFPVLTGVMAQSVESPDGIKLTPVKRLIRLFNLEKRDIYHIYFLALIVGLISLSLPLGVQAIIGLISGGLIIQSVVVLIMLVIMGTTLSGWLQIKQLELVETIQQRVFARSSFEYSFRLPRLKLEAMSDSYPPEMVNRFFDITNLQKGMPKLLIDFTGAILQIFFGLILLSFYHSMFILFGLLLVAILLIIFRFTGPRGLKTSLYESKYKYKVASWLEELARAINSIKLAGYTRLHIDKTDLYVSQYLKSRKAHFKVLKQQYAAMVVFKTVITAGLLILGSQLVVSRQINLGQFVAAEIVILLVITSVEKFIQSLEVIYDTLTAVEKMGALTDIPMESETGLPLSVTGNVDALSLRLNEVGYKYPSMNKAALQNVSFTLGAGSRMAITGTSGAGKSTLLKLVAGLFQTIPVLLWLMVFN